MISRQAFEQQLNLLGYRDTGHVSPCGTMKIWLRPNEGPELVLSNKDWIPSAVMSKVLDELGMGGPNLYGTPYSN